MSKEEKEKEKPTTKPMKKLLYVFIKQGDKVDSYKTLFEPIDLPLGNYVIQKHAKTITIEQSEIKKVETVKIGDEFFTKEGTEEGKLILKPAPKLVGFTLKTTTKGLLDIGTVCRSAKNYIKTHEADGIFGMLLVGGKIGIEKFQ